ncbi:hypothetical protein COEREDRAFT_89601 [Coemansia reversa NRRL 1564]|uniref:Uncharacterized protein n=1 Tax=Coemansia reversa (strain ATCC 12441 / NRRL 1564) TaxID=763665 RepID=A0A2G5B301_COERN|nr:hypothetical protein COEREDRAFT_89601 [Coemansia reversa NRRL 1564]|eukprot:PIA13398.1 hypothetical protein COEREDRAFT_89601 [Coemansia reversa NRRL 1564]
MSSLEDASTAQTNLQNVDLFNFPAPPSHSPEESPHLDKDGSINQKQDERAAVDKISLKAGEGLCINTGESAKIDVLPLLHIETTGISAARFNRISKSTISLPFFSEHSSDEMDSALDENDVFGEYKSPKGAKMFSHARGAKSHHHLPCVSDNAPLSQSLVSLANKGEQMSEVADLLSPIESGSYESDMEQSSEAITLVSHAHEHAVLRPKTSHHHQGPQTRHNVSATSHYNEDVPATQLRKQISMAQIESRYNNRNSMVVSDMLFSSTCEFGGEGFDAENPHLQLQPQAQKYRPQTRNHRQSCYQLDVDFNFDRSTNRASRYLYDVPCCSSVNGMQSTISKALQWPHRISQSAPKQLHRTRSSIIDQYKIYDIYEESIWHKTQTPSSSSACNTQSPGNTRSISNTAFLQKGNTAGGLAGARTQILRSVKSAGAHLSMLRPWKSRETPNRIRAEWELSSASSESTYSDGDYCSSFSGASQQEDMKPRHKHSTIQLIVKRAGLGLLRRSTSFYKSFSGASLSENSSAKGTGAVVSSFSKFSSISSGSSEYARKSKPKIGHRFATVVRQAGNRLKDTLRSHDKEDSHLQENLEIVSAYPADSATGKDLDTYLSMSAIHSPVPSAPVNSRANSGSDENIAREQECIMPSGYVPPKRPPYLGLHRSSIVEGDYDSVKEDSCNAIEDTSALPQIMPTTRLRATQFNSPFTTLPYGAYAQLQLKAHQYHS